MPNGHVLLVVRDKSLRDFVIERVSLELATEADFLGIGRLHDHLLHPVALDSYQAPVVLLALVGRGKPRVHGVILQVVLLVRRLMIALMINALVALPGTAEAHDSCL